MNEATVIRGGYGITYNPHPWGAQALRGWFPLTVVATFDGVNGFQPVTTGPGYVSAGVPNAPLGPTVGIPSICCPDISTGRVPLPGVAETGYPVANQQLHRGYIQSWNLIVERKLPWNLVGSLGYVGSASVRAFAFLNINASQVPGSGDEGRPLFQRFGRTSATREFDGRTHSNYHSLQTTLNRRFTDGLLLKAAYTYSRAIDEAPYSDWTEFMWNAPSVFHRNRAQADHNIPQNFQLGFVYELPFGPDKTWATDGHQRRDPGRLAAERGVRRLSGAPVHGVRIRRVVEHARQRADRRPGQGDGRNSSAKVGNAGTFFDTSAFARVTEVRFGNTGRNILRGPGVVNLDLSLFRTFRLTDRYKLQFRAEVIQREQHAALREPGK